LAAIAELGGRAATPAQPPSELNKQEAAERREPTPTTVASPELVADVQAGSGADEEAGDEGAQSIIRRDVGLLMRQAARRDPLNVLGAVAAKAPGVILDGKPKLSPHQRPCLPCSGGLPPHLSSDPL
jgi:hypothetical protein